MCCTFQLPRVRYDDVDAVVVPLDQEAGGPLDEDLDARITIITSIA